MSSKHSPGPWRTENTRDENGEERNYIVDANQDIVITSDDDEPQDIANLQLMSEAPCMLSILQLLINPSWPRENDIKWTKAAAQLVVDRLRDADHD